MYPLTVEKVIEIHEDILMEFLGDIGILNQGTLDLLVYRANREQDLFVKSSLVLYCIAKLHPFIDGNKRTALVTCENILGQYGYYIDSDEETIVNFMLQVANYEYSRKDIEKWLRENTSKDL